ncbi:hypothetical protein DCE79_14530 [Lysinibacillus sp. 2017]|uniref:hypothetical protein n=1 Tax=unclassified Lysinibacillus TaxID=2636778 RepID=UPI000D52654C|nr:MULTISPECIES: hypothetical protein [unclassified Lysinibacillus]AWE08511.1 hypothetical protein DCE79_14530 [Lysinibacillus sp. 2017]TGN35604.1 hypothetical protein E4L99_08360 [Lysinibacillus sp. S2017]
MNQYPFNPFDESPNGQPFNPFFPPSFDGPGSFPMNPPPFGSPGAPPMNNPQQPGGNTPMPPGPPPAFSPAMTMSGSQTGSSGISRCIYRNTFIWQRNGNSFWFFPTFVSRNVILGFRWGRFGWTFSTINRDSILTFQCF